MPEPKGAHLPCRRRAGGPGRLSLDLGGRGRRPRVFGGPTGRSPGRSSLMHQGGSALDPDARLRVVRKMYNMRLGEPAPSRRSVARRAARCTGVDRLRPGAATRFPEQDSDTENLMFLEGRTETAGEKPMRAPHPDLGANGSSGRRRLDAAAFVLEYPGACRGSAGAGRRGSRGACVHRRAFGQQARSPGKIPGGFLLIRGLFGVLCCAVHWKGFPVAVFSDRLRAGGSGPTRVRRGVASLTCTPCCRLFLVPVTRSRVRSVGQRMATGSLIGGPTIASKRR